MADAPIKPEKGDGDPTHCQTLARCSRKGTTCVAVVQPTCSQKKLDLRRSPGSKGMAPVNISGRLESYSYFADYHRASNRDALVTVEQRLIETTTYITLGI
jgi:hypothetical protein